MEELEVVVNHLLNGENLPSSFLSDRQWLSIEEELNLSDRQFEVTQYIFDGYSLELIGDELEISSNTVHAHVKKIYQKLSIHSRAELITILFLTHLHCHRHRRQET